MMDDRALTADIVAAYVSNNPLPASDLAALIAATYAALGKLSAPAPAPADVPAEKLVPAVPIKKSITPEFIICLDDGKAFKSLKRHLGVLGMTPETYRAKWGLPSDYPMVAPAYAERRSALAKSIGLGKLGKQKKKR